MIAAPASKEELLQRCEQLAGKTLGNVATQHHTPVPDNLLHHKGWIGQLMELALGADASNKAEPDFIALNIELKTLPLNTKHQPKESTFVCTVPSRIAETFEQSLVWKKLRHVLWLPIEAASDIPIAKRRIGRAILWQPSKEQRDILQQDWEELTEMLILGNYAELTAKHGTCLQCRPKAANNRITQRSINAEGDEEYIIPRGFYLRPGFTKKILER